MWYGVVVSGVRGVCSPIALILCVCAFCFQGRVLASGMVLENYRARRASVDVALSLSIIAIQLQTALSCEA